MPPSRLFAVAVGLAFGLAAPVSAQKPTAPESPVEKTLAAGQTAYNDGNHAVARERFKEVVAKFGTTPQATAARYGLGLCHLTAADPDYAKAVEELKTPRDDGSFPERPRALSLTGGARRQLGLRAADPAAAQQYYEKAAQSFATARDLWRERDPEASARARCDHAEMLIRANRTREARAECEPFLKDADFARRRARPLGLYYHGLACFLDKDLKNAGRSLMLLSPFDDPGFGPHSQYLAGRVCHLSGEPAEAGGHYEAVLATCQRLEAEPAAKADRGVPTKGRPDAAAGAAFYLATLSHEAGRVPEGLAKFRQFVTDYPGSLLAPDAALRVGCCQVQLRQYDDAVRTLTPLLDKPARLVDQAQFQLGKARLGLAASGPAGEREAKRKTAVEAIRKAADKAGALADQDPDARRRRAEMLFDLADALTAGKQSAEAVHIFETLWNEQALPARREEVLQRLADALGAAGQFDRCRQRCDEFVRAFPRSPLTPAVLLRVAENDWGRAVECLKDRSRAAEGQAKLAETAGVYRDLAEKFPEDIRVAFARFGQGVCEARLGQYDAAAKTFDAIPPADRVGELAATDYALADCLMRTAPDRPGDDAQGTQAREYLTRAVTLFEAFTAANPQSPDVPAALLKLGHCLKRLGESAVEAPRRARALERAGEVFARLAKEYPKNPLSGRAVVERAKVRGLLGDRAGAAADLQALLSNADSQSGLAAPQASAQLAADCRAQGRPAEAVKVLAEARKRLDAAAGNDPDRAAWVPLLKYHHGVAMLDAGKSTEGRAVLDDIARTAEDTAVGAEAALASARNRIAEGKKVAAAGQALLAQAGASNDKRNAAQQAIDRGRDAVREAANSLDDRANRLRDRLPGDEARGRMSYDAAWGWRDHAEGEVRRSREAARQALRQKRVAALVQKLPAGATPPDLPLPEVDAGTLPLTDSQTRAFEAYKRVVSDSPDAALVAAARLELAELLAERGDHEGAVKLLQDELGQGPGGRAVPAELSARVRLRLGACLVALRRFAPAAAQFDAVAADPKSGRVAEARDLAADAHLGANDRPPAPAGASDDASDRGLFRRGQALLGARDYGAARRCFEALARRGGPGAAEARHAAAVTLQAQGRYDEAVAAFRAELAAGGEVAAKSQLRIGQCRHAQQRYADAAAEYLVVPYSYPEWPALREAAVLEAARAFAAAGQSAQAASLLRKLAGDGSAKTVWTEAATERLAGQR